MDYTREQRAAAWDTLPEGLREFILSDEFAATVAQISKDNSLLLDKASFLSQEINLTLLGLKKAENLIPSIKAKLEVTDAVAAKIGAEVNEKVFLKVRGALQKAEAEEKEAGEQETVASVEHAEVEPAPQTTDNETRENILAEIENPTPTAHPISEAAESSASVAREFIGSKLTQTVSLPSQQAKVTLRPPTPKPQSYAADPYRESVN